VRLAPEGRVMAACLRTAMSRRVAPTPPAFREAAEKLRAGDRGVEFPPGSFPPRLPFVAV